MKRIFRLFTLAVLLLTATSVTDAQELLYNVEFETYLDNREYSASDEFKSFSGSDFAVTLIPEVGVGFDKHNRIFIGAEMTKNFGADDGGKFFSTISPMLYYAYDTERWSATAGLFQKSRMVLEDYSSAFFSEYSLFDDSIATGIMGRYMSGSSYVELVVDWEGQPSETTREKFRLLSSARKWFGEKFYLGYNLSITHFAGQELEGFGNVVDNVLVNPVVGFQLSGAYEFDARVGYLQSLQRDRSYGNEWLSPSMVELGFRIERWGLSLDEKIYIGDNLMPLYGGHTLVDGTIMEYGYQLYTGDVFFMTEGGYYNRAALSYDRQFYDGRVSLGVSFVTHAVKGGLTTEQLLQLTVSLGGRLHKW